MEFKKATTGTVIIGTRQAQDLIPALLDVLRDLDSPHAGELESKIAHAIAHEGLYGRPFWETDKAGELIKQMLCALEDHAPEEHYFGVRADDSADFGFWPRGN